jgi:fluoride exporter
MDRVLWISLAGAAGTAARYLLTVAITQRFGTSFPAATVIINLTGCFIMAAVMAASAAIGWSATVRMAVTVGFLGGFTTYSSFNQETMMLWERGATSAAMLNVAVTLLGGLAAGWVGMVVGRGLR